MQGAGDSQGGFLKRLSIHLLEKQFPVEVLNHGIGGQTTRDMLARLDIVQTLAPYDLVVILGCNDMPRNNDQNTGIRTTLDEYRTNLEKILGTIKGTRSLFISSFSVSEEKTGISPSLFDTYMGAAIDLARSFQYDIWDLYGETKGKTAHLLAADGVHFNDEGHALIAEKVGAWFLQAP